MHHGLSNPKLKFAIFHFKVTFYYRTLGGGESWMWANS